MYIKKKALQKKKTHHKTKPKSPPPYIYGRIFCEPIQLMIAEALSFIEELLNL